MVSTDSTEERILEGVDELFFRHGIRRVTMDDIAQHLSISKKTIYQHFKDKDEIVLKVVRRFFNHQKVLMDKFHQQAQNVIHEIVLISEYWRACVSAINPLMLFDLHKFYTKAWQIYLDFKKEELGVIEKTLQKGVDEELFRPNIDPHILAVLRIETVELTFDEEIFPRRKFSAQQVQDQVFEQFLYGILTQKGRRLYEQYTNKPIAL